MNEEPFDSSSNRQSSFIDNEMMLGMCEGDLQELNVQKCVEIYCDEQLETGYLKNPKEVEKFHFQHVKDFAMNASFSSFDDDVSSNTEISESYSYEDVNDARCAFDNFSSTHTSTIEEQVPEPSSFTTPVDDSNNSNSRVTADSGFVEETFEKEMLVEETLVEETLEKEKLDQEVSPPALKKRRGHKASITTAKAEPTLILSEFEMSRRVTRQLSNKKPTMRATVDNVPGKLVWGYFHNCWWPAIIIKAEDAGMIQTKGKIWVSWVGEDRISELQEKNVDLFSNDLGTRIHHLEITEKTKGSQKKLKEEACYRIIKLLKEYCNGSALMRPYTTWMKHNILPQKEKLDKLLFYPYSNSLSEKLKNLKNINFEKTEKFLQQQEKERLNKINESKYKVRKIEKLEKPLEVGGIDIMDQKPGMIVWAKIQGYNFWPCVIMDYQHLNRRQPNVAHQWVMWYGDYKYSQVEYRQIINFTMGMEKMEHKIRGMKDELFSKAVLRAAKDYYEQSGYLTEPWKIHGLIHRFYESGDKDDLRNVKQEPNEEDPYSQTIKKQLRKQINNQPVNEERKKLILKNTFLPQVMSRKLPLTSICATCFGTNELQDHPLFYASLCAKCLEDYEPKVFAYGNDAKCFYCSFCGGDDLVAMCDNINCPRVFCTACIKYIICPEFYEKILLKHPWFCFLCDSDPLADSIVSVRVDWRGRLLSIYRNNCDDEAPSNLERLDSRRNIRVLSLFDGIGTGLVVLKKLNIQVECYYASEIDPDSMQVSYFNHGNEIIQLGDVRNIDEKIIKEIAPIDLLIGGSPCNELSLANPKRRGLDDPNGSGILFYDYCRIKKLLKKYNKKRHLFWLFENVASMPKKYRKKISKNLGREPKFLDSADFSAQHRPRLYWGNLPWGPYELKNTILQNVLRERCNRQALVKKIMTVTTKTNSLNQTKENLRPVLMNGKKDMLWVTELEEIFGFPMHYTDANLQKTRRLQLIGKAWSVQTLMAILQPVFLF